MPEEDGSQAELNTEAALMAKKPNQAASAC